MYVNRNSNVGYRRRGGLGPELFVAGSAASDPNGNEADSTFNFTSFGLSGTGANVFESQGAVVSVGSYAIHADANDTPTGSANFQHAIAGAEAGKDYLLTFDWRHIGTGGRWRLAAPGFDFYIETAETTWKSESQLITAAGASIGLTFIESNATDNGGVYVDNISVRKIL